MIKSIQYGVMPTNFGGTSQVSNINAVDPNKSLVFSLGWWHNASDPSRGYYRLELTTSTTVTMYRMADSGQDGEVYFMVIEWGSGVSQMQRGKIDIPNAAVQADKTIPAVDLTKTILAWCGCQAQDTGSTGVFGKHGSLCFVNANTLRAIRRDASLITSVGYNLIEFS